MGIQERIGSDSSEALLNAWFTGIEARWGHIPEYRVDSEKLKHLAIICDGNRRAAGERGFDPYFGHRAGVETIKGIASACRQWEVDTVSFWVWSTENWGREQGQVEFVMKLAEEFLSQRSFFDELKQNRVRFRQIGRKDRLPVLVGRTIHTLEEETKNFDRYKLNLVMDYGGLDEVARAAGRMFEVFRQGEFDPETLKRNPQGILGFLDTAAQVVPDLVIRTGVKEGEIPHTSGFMPLQTAYAGWVFLPDLFPDLTPQDLLRPMQSFIDYERRLGK